MYNKHKHTAINPKVNCRLPANLDVAIRNPLHTLPALVYEQLLPNQIVLP